jgi:hypothetical protein
MDMELVLLDSMTGAHIKSWLVTGELDIPESDEIMEECESCGAAATWRTPEQNANLRELRKRKEEQRGE